MSLHLCYSCLCIVVMIALYLLVFQSITSIAAALLMCAVDGMWGPWKMLSKKGESGVWWRAELRIEHNGTCATLTHSRYGLSLVHQVTVVIGHALLCSNC